MSAGAKLALIKTRPPVAARPIFASSDDGCGEFGWGRTSVISTLFKKVARLTEQSYPIPPANC
jgi:hypothetical protein